MSLYNYLHTNIQGSKIASISFLLVLGKGLICCGDDKGSLWLYNLPQFGRDSPTPALKTKIDVTTRLMWPELQASTYTTVAKKIHPLASV